MEKRGANLLQTGAVLVILGVVFSGPPMVFLVEYLRPQPKWVDADLFISHFHGVQTLPYWFGFLLMAGNILFIISLCRMPGFKERANSLLSLICLTIYGALVFINYSIQTTAIPALVSQKSPFLEAFTMANPSSICWTIEMFAYAILGVAYWLTATAFPGKGILRIIRYLMVFNGISSVLGILIPVIDPKLLLESEGIAGYILWNLLIVVIMVFVIVAVVRNKIETQEGR